MAEFLKAMDVAPLLGVQRTRVYQLIAAGVIPHVVVGGAIRIPKAAWDVWIAQQNEQALASIRCEEKAPVKASEV